MGARLALTMFLLLAGERGPRLGDKRDDDEGADAAVRGTGTGLMVRNTLFMMVKAGMGLLPDVLEDGTAVAFVVSETVPCFFLARAPCSIGQ